MAYIIIDVVNQAGAACVATPIPTGRTAAQIAAGYGISDTNRYDEVADNAFTDDQYRFAEGFVVTNGTATWDIATARTVFKQRVEVAYGENLKATIAASNFTATQIAAQSALASGSRNADANTLITAMNTNVTTMATKLGNVDSAADAAALKAIYDSIPTFTNLPVAG